MPQMRKLTTTVIVAARAFEEALPKVSWTRLAVAPFSFRCVIRRSAKAFVSLPDEWKYETATSAAGRTESVE